MFFLKILAYTILFPILGLMLLLEIRWLYFLIKHFFEQKWTKIKKLNMKFPVRELTILPLVEEKAKDDRFKTEPGVSYYITADSIKILMDVGFNKNGEHPSPLLANARELGIDLTRLNAIFISHLHLDHVGGMQAQRNSCLTLSQGPIDLPKIPVYSPDPMVMSDYNSAPKSLAILKPRVLSDGIASIGTIPRTLFLSGYTRENALAFLLEGKGIVLVIGCGHQSIQRIIKRTKALFNQPIYAIIGGLHFPVKGGRIMVGPLNLQNLFGMGHSPWTGGYIRKWHVRKAIYDIAVTQPKIVALSPHDSSDWAIEQFRQAFGSRYRDLMVGEPIKL